MAITLANTEIVFPNGSTQNSAPTGVIGTSQSYVKLPSGLVLMFGSVATTATSGTVLFSYPTIFTEVFQVQLQSYGVAGTDTGGVDWHAGLRFGTANTTGFSYSVGAYGGFFWLAIGKG